MPECVALSYWEMNCIFSFIERLAMKAINCMNVSKAIDINILFLHVFYDCSFFSFLHLHVCYYRTLLQKSMAAEQHSVF